MENKKFESLHNKVQEIIDLIANKQHNEAIAKLSDVRKLLENLIDFSSNDEDLIKISKYQLLLNQLFKKINT